MVQVHVSQKDLDSNNGEGGLEIYIEGVAGSPEGDADNPCPIFIENYKGDIRVLIWNDTIDPQIIVLKRQPVS
jgi:hypothetical protein